MDNSVVTYVPSGEVDTAQAVRPAEASPKFDPRAVLAIFRRRLRLFLLVFVLVFSAIMMVTLQSPPKFTATSSILIDARQQNLGDNQLMLSGMPADSNLIDTDVQILSSRAIAETVVRRLNLQYDPEFGGSPRKAGADGSITDIDGNVTSRLMGSVQVRRLGLTYVINVTATARDAEKSARIANAFGDAFLSERQNALTNVARDTSSAVSSQLEDLRQQVQRDDSAVQQYKIAHNLISASGATNAEQEVSALNQQIALAEADRSEKEARLGAARAQVQKGGGGADIGAALGSETIRSLRAQEATISLKLADMQTRYGDLHPDVQKAKNQLADVRTQIQLELNRILSSLEAEARVARDRVNSLKSSLSSARGSLSANNSAEVGLLELQRKADASKAIYEAYLTKSKVTSAAASVVQPEGRIVSRALTPKQRSSPQIRLAAIFATAASFGAAVVVIFLVEMFNSGIETGDQVERRFGVPFAGSVPRVRTGKGRGRSSLPPQDYLVAQPFSAFAESLRGLRAFLTLQMSDPEKSKVIVVTSALPREGKTVTTFCLARAMAMAGSSVVLVDCDLRRRGVSALAHATGTAGIVQVLSGEASLDEALIHDEATGAVILPVAEGPNPTRDLFASKAWDMLLAELGVRFDHVIIDTPPVLAVADARTLASKANMTLLLDRWRTTPFKATDAAIDLLIESGANLVGVALTNVDLVEQSRTGYGDRYYYYQYYTDYYVDN